MKTQPKCIVKNFDDKKSCTNEIVILLKVKLYHPTSERKSSQQWYLCDKHFHDFLETKGKGWYRWYNKEELGSPVIYFEIITYTEFISVKLLKTMYELIENFEKSKYNLLQIM